MRQPWAGQTPGWESEVIDALCDITQGRFSLSEKCSRQKEVKDGLHWQTRAYIRKRWLR